MDTGQQTTTKLVRRIVVTAMMVAITVLLGLLPVGGFIPFPTGVNATTLHIPAIVGGILEGWLVGGLVGFFFGLFSLIRATTPLFKDPVIAIIPRLFIGVTAYFTYAGLKRFNELLAVGVGAAIGTATNTVLVLGLAVLRGYMSPAVAGTVAVTHGIPEIIVAVIITVSVVAAWRQISTRPRGSSV